jgi:hypothetical protein
VKFLQQQRFQQKADYCGTENNPFKTLDFVPFAHLAYTNRLFDHTPLLP